MKLFLSLICLIGIHTGYAQDTLTKKDGSVYIIDIVDKNAETIRYRNHGSADGPIRHIYLKDIESISYADGNKVETKSSTAPKPVEEQSMTRPYLKDWDGNVTYYDRVGFHQKFYIAYDSEGVMHEIEHKYIQSGCVSKKTEAYQFITRDIVRAKGRGAGYVLREGTDEKLFILCHEGSNMLMCKDLFEKPVRHGMQFAAVGSGYGGTTVATPFYWRPILSSSHGSEATFYYYDGVNITELEFTQEEAEQWRIAFGDCPFAKDAFDRYDGTSKEQNDVINLMEELTYYHYNNCYIQLD